MGRSWRTSALIPGTTQPNVEGSPILMPVKFKFLFTFTAQLTGLARKPTAVLFAALLRTMLSRSITSSAVRAILPTERITRHHRDEQDRIGLRRSARGLNSKIMCMCIGRFSRH